MQQQTRNDLIAQLTAQIALLDDAVFLQQQLIIKTLDADEEISDSTLTNTGVAVTSRAVHREVLEAVRGGALLPELMQALNNELLRLAREPHPRRASVPHRMAALSKMYMTLRAFQQRDSKVI